MFFVSDIPHLKAYRQKVFLPVDPKIQSMYSIVFVNNMSTESVINLINHPKLSHNNKYHFYYIDNLYHGKLFNKTYRDVLTKEREGIYDLIKSKVKFISTERSFANINNRNVYFDLQHYNNLFFRYSKRSSTYKKKVELYFEFLKSIINDSRFSKYKNKLVVIDVNEWTSNVKVALSNNQKLDNPIMYIYFSLLKQPEIFKQLGDINIVFYSDDMIVRLNPTLCDKNSYMIFRRELSKIRPNLIEEDKKLEDEFNRDEVYQKVIKNFSERFNFTGDDEDGEEIEEKVKERLEELEEEEEPQEIDKEKLEKKLTEKLVNDEKLLKDIYTIAQEKKVGKSSQSLKRDEELREKQKQLKLENLSIEDIRKIETEAVKIEKKDVSDKVKTTNKNMTTIKYPHFEKAYNENLYKKDLINVIMHLNNTSIPVFVRDIKVEDSSDELNYKETYTVELEDSNRVRHKLKFDMPKFIDDKFMYLNGNKKIFIKQLFMKPIVKTGPNEVQVCTNYKKIFLRRYGTKVSSKIEKFKKALNTELKGIVVRYGNNLAVNNKYKTTIEYDEISKDISYIKIGRFEFYFNQDEVTKLLEERKIKLSENKLCLGFIDKKEIITVDLDSQLIGDMDIVDYILKVAGEDFRAEFESASAGKKYLYTRATVMKKQVPLILFLGYLEGLSTILRKAGIRHYFSDARPKVDSVNQGVVQFANGYLVYDRYPFENSLLMNAFADIPTRSFNYEDFDSKDAYLTLFDIMFNQRNIGNAFDNFYDFMIDPITKEVLEDLNYPTTFVEVMLFANALLTDNSFLKENNMNLYRIRSNEIVNAYLYGEIADAYGKYRTSAFNNNPKKISIPQDAVIKKILTAINIEDYSILNPK